MINVEKLDVPACSTISWLSSLSYWIGVEQYVLRHKFNCLTCESHWPSVESAWHSHWILHGTPSPFCMNGFCLSYWSSHGNKMIICFIVYYVNGEVCKPRISSRKWKPLNITIWSKVVSRQMFCRHFSNNLCTIASLVNKKPHFLQPCQIVCTVSWE